MPRQSTQKGSVMAIIVAFLVVALSAALGVIFYQNFIANQAAETNSETATELTLDEAMQVSQAAFGSKIYELTHPKSWESKVSAKDGVQTLLVTSPDGAVAVTLQLSQRAADRPCNLNDGLKVRYHTAYDTPVVDLADQSQFVVESISDYPGGGYQYLIGLAPDGGETNASVGDARCVVKNVGIVSLADPAIIGNITFPQLAGVAESRVDSMESVKDIFATETYKTAISILESARKK
jgi:hypothetical protein